LGVYSELVVEAAQRNAHSDIQCAVGHNRDQANVSGAFKRRRCLMPGSGYFEWQTIGKDKQPWYFTRKDQEPITIAGIHEAWNSPEGERLWTCSMVITEPNNFVRNIHDRMPVILDKKDFEQWERGDAKDAAALMKPAAEDLLQMRTVSKRVNSSRADENDATLIERI
jgi:putative SOS response-associated peptidase YedK